MPEPKPITITLPWPDTATLNSHNKGHWRAKAGPTRKLREACCVLARGNAPAKPWKRARLLIRIFHPDARGRDNLNVIQSLKPAIDGCVDAGVIADDKWTCLQGGEWESDLCRDDPRIELTFVPLI